MKFRPSLFKGLRVKGRALAVSKGRAFGGSRAESCGFQRQSLWRVKGRALRFPKAEAFGQDF